MQQCGGILENLNSRKSQRFSTLPKSINEVIDEWINNIGNIASRV